MSEVDVSSERLKGFVDAKIAAIGGLALSEFED